MAEHSCDVSIADFDEKVLAASRQVPVVVDGRDAALAVRPAQERLGHDHAQARPQRGSRKILILGVQ